MSFIEEKDLDIHTHNIGIIPVKIYKNPDNTPLVKFIMVQQRHNAEIGFPQVQYIHLFVQYLIY